MPLIRGLAWNRDAVGTGFRDSPPTLAVHRSHCVTGSSTGEMSSPMTTGDFEFSRLTQRIAAPGAALPQVPQPRGENHVRVIGSLEEMRAAVDAVAASAQRLMSIYTPDLEPEIYDQNGFLEIVKRFVLARRFAKVRVLLSDSGRLLRDNNRFIAMGRRLTSCIDIRPALGTVKQRAAGYLIADDQIGRAS